MICSSLRKTTFMILTLFLFLQVAAWASEVAKPPTPPLTVATEYARELISIEEVRARGEADMQGTVTSQEKLTSGIHFSTLIQLELKSQIRMLKDMRLTEQFADLIPGLIAFDKHKIDLHQQMIDVVTEILSGPKPGVDYGKVAAQMPKIRAELEDVDHTIFTNVTPLICMILIDMRPDSKNHVSHLVITKAEKVELIERLVSGFGDAFNQKQKYFMVSAGLVMKGFLDDHASSDDPWE